MRVLPLALLPALAWCLLAAGCRSAKRPPTAIIFAAASLDQVLADLGQDLRARGGPTLEVQISGSEEAARKISEYGLRADALLVADYRVIASLLQPTRTAWNVRFASNAVVIAYTDRSRYATEITAANWPDVLLRPGVTVARADAELAPIGYQTLLCWKLAAIRYATLLGGRDLYWTLLSRSSGDLVRPDVTSLLPLLGTRADYAFVYRSVAHGHNLPFVTLAPEVNLADPAQAAFYARAEVALQHPKRTVRGAPIVYGATIPLNAPHPDAAARFLEALLGPAGRKALEANGFAPLTRPTCDHPEALPAPLRTLVGQAP